MSRATLGTRTPDLRFTKPSRKAGKSKVSAKRKPGSGIARQMTCAKMCDHGSPCLFVADHSQDFYDPHWSVHHHLPGGRYGKISIRFDDESVAHMVADNDEKLALAKRIVDVLNRNGIR